MSHFVETHVAGDTLDFQVAVPEYPNTDGWTLKYRLTPRFTTPTQAPIELTAVNNTDGTYQVQESPANTADWEPGFYSWARWVEKVGAVQTLTERGQLEVRPDPRNSTQGLDTRTHARKMLDQIEAALEAFRVGVKSYTIGSRSMTKQDTPELFELRDRYRAEVAAEEANERLEAGQPSGGRLLARL